MRRIAALAIALAAASPFSGAAAGDDWFGDEKPAYQPREIVVLFEIQAPGLEFTEQKTVNYFVERELASLAYHDVLSGEALAKKLGVGRLPVCSDADCRHRTATNTGSSEYIHGSVNGDSEDVEVTLERVKAATGEVLAKKSYRWQGGAISIPMLTAWLAIQLYLPAEALVDGQLQLDVKPRLTSIRADGSEVLVPSDNTIRLEAGVHRIDLDQPGYAKATLPVVILPKRVNYQRVELKPE